MLVTLANIPQCTILELSNYVLFYYNYNFFFYVLGSVIKHHLVTHLSLGIALRYVLDALRKPADSKVCCFEAWFSFKFHFMSA